jgi:site-specific DNA-methyltransferase (adenine-specific)
MELKEIIGNCTLYLGAMEKTIGGIEYVDHILTDPPYLYIKTHDFDREWNEQLFFENAKRLLPDDGFIALFGRGTSFYRWNIRLADLGFVFKEEIIWEKPAGVGPMIKISRVHETISIHTKKRGTINKSVIPYTEQRQFDLKNIINDIKHLKAVIKHEARLGDIIDYLQTGIVKYNRVSSGQAVTVKNNFPLPNPEINTIKKIKDGMREKTVIKINAEKIKNQHPAEKPVRLAERLLALISDPGDTIYDPFMGSGSFGVACINTGRKYIGSEMKPEYFEAACKRIKEAYNQHILAEACNG